MSYYKYAEQDASTQLNWAEIGKNVTDMLQQEVKVREEKKAVIDENTRNYGNYLNEAPQGKFQDANKFVNDYVALQQETRLMDDKLLKSGQMDLKTYTTRRQNGMDGTDQLFNLQKQFQSVHEERMKGIMDGTLTAQNAFEMMQVQGFGDFSKSQAMINPVDGRVNIGMTEVGEDGIRRVIKDSNIPVNVLMGKIQSELKTFDVNLATKSLVDSLGDRVLDLYRAGSVSGMGSITELTGIDAIKKFSGKTWTEAATEMNKAIKNSVDGILANPRNLPSLLTQNIGGYSSESFTYSREEAEKDPNKILLKAGFGPGEMDENGPNYAEQKAKAESWLTTSIKSQMDAKVSKKETNQVQLQERRPKTEGEYKREDLEKEAENFAENVAYLQTGNDAQKAAATAYFRGRGVDIVSNPAGKPKGNYIRNKNGELAAFESVGSPKSGTKSIVGALIAASDSDIPEDMVVRKAIPKLGARYNTSWSGTGTTVDTEAQVAKIINKVSDVNLFKDQNSADTASVIEEQIGAIPSIKISAEGGGLFKGNNITISKKGATTLVINSNVSGTDADNQSKKLKEWLQKNLTDEEKRILSGESSAAGTGTTSGGTIRGGQTR